MSPSRSLVSYVSASLGGSMQAPWKRRGCTGSFVSCLYVRERSSYYKKKAGCLLWTIEKMSLRSLPIYHG